MNGVMQCEKHPGVVWPHDDCPGPGMPSADSVDGSRGSEFVNPGLDEAMRRGYETAKAKREQ